MFVTRVSNCLPRRGFKETPHDLWFGKDTPPCRFLKYLQPFGRVAHIARHSSTRTRMSPKGLKVIFIGYPEDHAGDTYRLYNPLTRKCLMSRNVTWMEWHGRQTAQDDMPLFSELNKFKNIQSFSLLPRHLICIFLLQSAIYWTTSDRFLISIYLCPLLPLALLLSHWTSRTLLFLLFLVSTLRRGGISWSLPRALLLVLQPWRNVAFPFGLDPEYHLTTQAIILRMIATA